MDGWTEGEREREMRRSEWKWTAADLVQYVLLMILLGTTGLTVDNCAAKLAGASAAFGVQMGYVRSRLRCIPRLRHVRAFRRIEIKTFPLCKFVHCACGAKKLCSACGTKQASLEDRRREHRRCVFLDKYLLRKMHDLTNIPRSARIMQTRKYQPPP